MIPQVEDSPQDMIVFPLRRERVTLAQSVREKQKTAIIIIMKIVNAITLKLSQFLHSKNDNIFIWKICIKFLSCV